MIFKHIREYVGNTPQPKGGATLVADLEKDQDQYKVSFARCNPKDLYCKKTGRKLATSRLKTNDPKYVVVVTRDEIVQGARRANLSNPFLKNKDFEEFVNTLRLEQISMNVVWAIALEKINSMIGFRA